MRRMLGSIVAAALAFGAAAAERPYNETADATADLRSALAAARADRNDVLVVFGANWGPDCRALCGAVCCDTPRQTL